MRVAWAWQGPCGGAAGCGPQKPGPTSVPASLPRSGEAEAHGGEEDSGRTITPHHPVRHIEMGHTSWPLSVQHAQGRVTIASARSDPLAGTWWTLQRRAPIYSTCRQSSPFSRAKTPSRSAWLRVLRPQSSCPWRRSCSTARQGPQVRRDWGTLC